MKTERLMPTPGGMARAAELLRAGEVVAFPTETVYGLGADARREDAVERVFAAKGRPGTNPLIAHVHDAGLARAITGAWPEAARRLAEAFWPGPLTMVLPANEVVCARARGGGPTVGVRMPANAVAWGLIEEVGFPLAAPSANRSGQLSPVTAEQVLADLDGRIAAVMGGPPATVGIESTVIDLSGEEPTVLRPGAVSRAQLAAVLGRPVAAGWMASAGAGGPARSPGMLDRHYAPRTPLHVVDRAEMGRAPAEAPRVWCGNGDGVARAGDMALPADPEGYAAGMYAALWAADASGAAGIWLERPPGGEDWEAVHDRLRRASAREGSYLEPG